MKLLFEYIFAYLLVIALVMAAPAQEGPNDARNVDLAGAQSSMNLDLCPRFQWKANETFWQGILPDRDRNILEQGYLDLRPLAKIVSDKGTEFEEYIQDRMGNFVRTLANGFVDPWNSLLYKLNALTAPILMAPYNVPRTSGNAAQWDAWFNALQDLYPAGSLRNHCHPNATSPDYRPWNVAFPRNLTSTNPQNEIYASQPMKLVNSRIWEVFTDNKITAPHSLVVPNNQQQCVPSSFAYTKEVTESTTSMSETQYTESTTVSNSIELSASAGFSLFSIDISASTTIQEGLEKTTGRSMTTSEAVTTSTTIKHDYGVQPQIRPNSILNITMWTDQYEADVHFTGDGEYYDNTTGILVFIEGHGKQGVGGANQILNMINRNRLMTPAKIRNVARLAADVLKADWSDAFFNSLVTTSSSGISNSIAGKMVIMEIHECDINSVPVRTCTPYLAEHHPPTSDLCPSRSRVQGEETGDSNFVLPPQLEDVPKECYTIERVEGYTTRWAINVATECEYLVRTLVPSDE
eukprot:Clim_evm85s108 gene=Clim_evmTU85s108